MRVLCGIVPVYPKKQEQNHAEHTIYKIKYNLFYSNTLKYALQYL